MLNRRHKAILFITLVMTGSALLAGAQLNEGLGIFILGVAFAWVIGSKAASRTCHFLITFPGKSWPWTRVLVLMALGGSLLASVAILSSFNSFLVVATMSIFGLLISQFRHLPNQRRWPKWIAWTLGIVAFFLATVAVSSLSGVPPDSAERMGRLVWWGLVALTIGMLWLTKGWILIVAGITAEKSDDLTAAPESANSKGTSLLYLSLLTGTLLLSLALGSLAFSAFSDAVFPFPTVTRTTLNSSSPVSPIVFLMLLAWWPYASWKAILKRKPNTKLDNVRTHQRVTFALGAVFTIILSVAITFGVQNGHDRSMTSQVEAGMKSFQTVAAKIGAIKRRDLQTTGDYIQAYAEIDPLLTEFNTNLRQFTNILAQAKQRDRGRGPLNIQRLYENRESEWLVWDDQMFDLLRQDSELTGKEVEIARQMGALPKTEQVDFWKRNFQPLIEQENESPEKDVGNQGQKPCGRMIQ